jgi:hypothetical protein
MNGMSSTMSEAVCTISMAQAGSRLISTSAPRRVAVRSVIKGRIRFPGATRL